MIPFPQLAAALERYNHRRQDLSESNASATAAAGPAQATRRTTGNVTPVGRGAARPAQPASPPPRRAGSGSNQPLVMESLGARLEESGGELDLGMLSEVDDT